MEADTGDTLSELRVDGGMVANRLLMQFLADVLQMDVVLPANVETTVLGAAYGAGLAAGVWSSTEAIERHWAEGARYQPSITSSERDALVTGWEKALERSLGWVSD
jgi:glycerol kinase